MNVNQRKDYGYKIAEKIFDEKTSTLRRVAGDNVSSDTYVVLDTI